MLRNGERVEGRGIQDYQCKILRVGKNKGIQRKRKQSEGVVVYNQMGEAGRVFISYIEQFGFIIKVMKSY